MIYIENKIFVNHTLNTKMIYDFIQNSSKKNGFDFDVIQLDCDWDKSTKAKYFSFLEEFRKISGKKISATIRLHQLKYHKKTGVPPVDFGVLMYYNMSDFKDINTQNYILDNKIGKQYLTFDTKYPLKLDIALPIYNQVVITRYKQIVSVIDNPNIDFKNFEQIDKNRFLCKKESFINSKLIYEGDVIRVDKVTIEDLKEAIKYLNKHLKKPENIIFFRYDNLSDFGFKKLQEIAEN